MSAMADWGRAVRAAGGSVAWGRLLIIRRSWVRAPPAPPAVLIAVIGKPWTGSHTNVGGAMYRTIRRIRSYRATIERLLARQGIRRNRLARRPRDRVLQDMRDRDARYSRVARWIASSGYSMVFPGLGWPGCCARPARRGNVRAASGAPPPELEDRLVQPNGLANVALRRAQTKLAEIFGATQPVVDELHHSPGRTVASRLPCATLEVLEAPPTKRLLDGRMRRWR
jgi:hypothetical protein